MQITWTSGCITMKRKIQMRVADEVSLPADKNSSGMLVRCACVSPAEHIRSTVVGDEAVASTASSTSPCMSSTCVVAVAAERCCTLAALRRTCVAIWRVTAATWRLSTMKRRRQPGTRSPCTTKTSVVVKTFLKKLETKTKTFAQNSTIKFHFKSNKCIHTHSGTFCCTLQCTSNSLQYYNYTNVHYQLHANHCQGPTFTSRYSCYTSLKNSRPTSRPSRQLLKTKTKTLALWSRDQDRVLWKMNSSALESRDLGLEITTLTKTNR